MVASPQSAHLCPSSGRIESERHDARIYSIYVTGKVAHETQPNPSALLASALSAACVMMIMMMVMVKSFWWIRTSIIIVFDDDDNSWQRQASAFSSSGCVCPNTVLVYSNPTANNWIRDVCLFLLLTRTCYIHCGTCVRISFSIFLLVNIRTRPLQHRRSTNKF